MKKQVKQAFILTIGLWIWITGCSQHPTLEKEYPSIPSIVKPGIEVLAEQNFGILMNKRVGLITNATGVDRGYRSTIDILNESPNVNLTSLFGPEHGVRGDRGAGEYVHFYMDEKTKLPVFSLYGETRKPTQAMLKNVDVLIFDIQDIGCRSYTYISTLGLCMEAASELGIEVVVLDRPNPLGGDHVEGNLVQDGYHSFVGQYSIPYVYGLTVGELAKMLNSEKLLTGGVTCDLTVIPMDGWKRSMTFQETGLPWIPTSPHIPHDDTPFYYVGTGILGELGVFSNGVGYTLPFRIIGAPWINGEILAKEMNEAGLSGVTFRPITYKPYYGYGRGKSLSGVQIHYDDSKQADLMSIQFKFLEVHHKLYPNKNPFKLAETSRLVMFDKVTGTSKVREIFGKNFQYDDLKEYFRQDETAFQTVSKQYYLYD